MSGAPEVTDAQLDQLVALATSAAHRAGALIRDERPDRLGVDATKSSPTDVVTVMDRRSEVLLHELLLGARPDDGLLGEEGASVAGTSGLTWVVDPIDGTVNYLYEIPAYAVSIAVVTGDPRTPGGYEVLAGVVHNPVLGETFSAVRGRGARLTDPRGERPLAVRVDGDAVTDLGQALLATGFGYEARRRVVQAEVVQQLLPRVRDIRRIGSGALDLCNVAAGRVDGYFERGLSPWDLAAGELVAREAGALVTGLGDAPAGHELVVAAPPVLHGLLQRELAPLRPDRDA
ncbi:inositol monophosphatase family protein [Angustibacter aerolatus]